MCYGLLSTRGGHSRTKHFLACEVWSKTFKVSSIIISTPGPYYPLFFFLFNKVSSKSIKRERTSITNHSILSVFSLLQVQMGLKVASLSLPYILVFTLVFGFGSSNIDQDKAECADKLVGLATCLPYVGGDAKTPTIDCCTGLKQVVDKSKKCLCVLIKDRNDPNLGLKVNATLALQLPGACKVPLNVTKCVDLLDLAPNSSDAKMFEDFGKKTANNTITPVGSGNSTSHGTSAEVKSEAWRGKRWVGIPMFFGTLVCIFTPHLVFYV